MHWPAQTLHDALLRNAELYGTDEAVVIGDVRLEYGELYQHVMEMARGLSALGVKHGDHVAVCMGNTSSRTASRMRT
jgi:non-ribosomal peptide synthetase component E (peptide arylation enzyme)